MIDQWEKCYGESWQGIIGDDALLVGVFGSHMAFMTECYQVVPCARRFFGSEQSGRSDVMNVQFSFQYSLMNSTLRALVLLLKSNLFSYFVPSFAVGSPATKPKRILFAYPVDCFPVAEAAPVAKVNTLPSSLSGFLLPQRNFEFCIAVAAFDENPRIIFVLLPMVIHIEFRAATSRTEIPLEFAIRLKRERLRATCTGCFKSSLLARRILGGKKPATTGHRTETAVLGFLPGKIRLDLDFLAASDAIYFDSR